MDLKGKILRYKALAAQIAALEEERKNLNREIAAEMPSNKFEIDGYKLSRTTQLYISTPLEQARLFDATRMEETLDKTKLKEIYRSGTPLEGVKEVTYVTIKEPVEINVPL